MRTPHPFLLRVVKINLASFLVFTIIFALARFFEFRLLNYGYSFIVLFVSLVLGGINIATLFQYCLKKAFNGLEFLNIASMSGLLLIPALYFLEMSFLKNDYSWLPIINALALFIAVLIIYMRMKEPVIGEEYVIDRRNRRQSFILFGTVAALFLLIIVLISTSYFPLLEQDPYHWMNKYRESFVGGKLDPLSDRPLFLVLTRIFINTARIDTYAYFKYVLPLLSCLILVPTWLVASRFKSRIHQLAILVIPLASPSTILYQITPMPQMIAIIATSNFLFWLVYSRLSGNKYFYYLAGISILLASFYYEMAVIIFIIWILVTIIHDRRKIIGFVSSNKLAVFLVMIIIFPYFSFVRSLQIFVIFWIQKIYGLVMLFQTNWLFPAFYVNVDQNQMGWSGILGVSKYYLFYVGPPLLFTAGFFCWLLFFRKSFRRYVLRVSISSPETIIIGLSLFTFVLISDVLPRVVNIALLPERAWIFGGIFLSVFVIGILRYFKEVNIYYSLFIGIFTLVSVGAAIRINDLKKYVVPDYQLQSADWIRSNLPGNRIILFVGNVELLGFHANSVMYNMPANFYCDEELKQPNNLWRMFEDIKPVSVPQKILAQQRLSEIKNYLGQMDTIDAEKLYKIINEDIANNKGDKSEVRVDRKENVYIYYFKDDSRNPYAQRPYRRIVQQCSSLVFDTNSDAYERVYSDQDRVIIWRVK